MIKFSDHAMCHVYTLSYRSPQTAKRKTGIQDWHLMLFVLLLILVDVGFMCLHIILEGAIAHFNIRQTKSDEKPVSVEGVSPKTLASSD